MSYSRAMEAAGATIEEFQEFGSYQGDWLAIVTWKGDRVLVAGGYGSCSGCDAFEGEFGYEYHEHPDNEYFNPGYGDPLESCEKCADYKRRLVEFGRSYLDDPRDPVRLRAQYVEQSEWDGDARDIVRWLDEHFPLAMGGE